MLHDHPPTTLRFMMNFQSMHTPSTRSASTISPISNTVSVYFKCIPVGTISRCPTTKPSSRICMKMAPIWASHCIRADRVHKTFTCTTTTISRPLTLALRSYFTIKPHRNRVAAIWNIRWPMHPF